MPTHELRRNRRERVDGDVVHSGGEAARRRGDGLTGGTLEPGQLPPTPPAGMRYVGFCGACRDFVELDADFACERAGHPRESIRVALLAREDEPLPHMPALNVGALFMPALWGPVHGQWYMILFYPLWLVLDNLIYGAVHGSGMAVLAVVASLLTAAFTIYYALHANSWGYVRAAADRTPDEYLRVERRWSVVFVLIAIAFLVFASWYNVAVRPGLPA